MCGALAVWLLTISMTAHVFTITHNTTHCESFLVDPQMNLNWHKFGFLFAFMIPLLVILYCTVHIIIYLRRRQLAQQAKIKKALWFITVVAFLFIICFLPSNIIQLLLLIRTKELARTLSDSEVCPAVDDLTTAFYVTICLTYLNSGLDPVVYYFSSSTFQNICRKALRLPQADTVESSRKKTQETGSQSLDNLWSHGQNQESHCDGGGCRASVLF